MKIHFVLALAAFLMTAAAPARAQTAAASPQAMQSATAIAGACLANWEAPACLSAVSASNLILAANYGTALQQSGHAAQAEQIKQHCAAATAATRGTYPAYAMRSAFTECANTISDVSDATGLQPDATQYQLLVGPVLCLTKDPRCAAVTAGLQGLAGR